MTSPSALPPVASEITPAAVMQQLKSLFPALFSAAKPLKLRIQADIQERAPGQFTKQQLSAALRRLTGSTAYLIALSKATHRYDLEGAAAGELAEEHRQAALTELARRRALQQERREQEVQQRRDRAALLRAFETTTLTRANFCALKGVAEPELDALLEQARQEAEEDRVARASQALGHGKPDHRGARRDGPRGVRNVGNKPVSGQKRQP